jgi:hypothetical protein
MNLEQLMQGFDVRTMLMYGIGAGLFTFLALGISTTIIPNPIFPREEAVRVVDYVILGIMTVLAAALGATFAAPRACPLQKNRLWSGGILSFLSIGCPVCNVAVVALIGTGGAMAWFAPVQPILGIIAIGLLSWALVTQIRAIRGISGPTDTFSTRESEVTSQ